MCSRLETTQIACNNNTQTCARVKTKVCCSVRLYMHVARSTKSVRLFQIDGCCLICSETVELPGKFCSCSPVIVSTVFQARVTETNERRTCSFRKHVNYFQYRFGCQTECWTIVTIKTGKINKLFGYRYTIWD